MKIKLKMPLKAALWLGRFFKYRNPTGALMIQCKSCFFQQEVEPDQLLPAIKYHSEYQCPHRRVNRDPSDPSLSGNEF